MAADSWLQIVDELYEGSWNQELRRFRSPYAFRGLSSTDHMLKSTLVRLAGDGAADAGRLELALLRNFRKYARADATVADSIWDWLALGQHRGPLRDFDALSREPFVVFLEPPAVDRRILNQLALFSLMSDPAAVFDDWLRRHRSSPGASSCPPPSSGRSATSWIRPTSTNACCSPGSTVSAGG